MLPNALGAAPAPCTALATSRWLGSGSRSEPYCVLVEPPLLQIDLGANLLCFHSEAVLTCEPAKMDVSFIGAFRFVTGENATQGLETLYFLCRNTSKSIMKRCGRGPVLTLAATRCS